MFFWNTISGGWHWTPFLHGMESYGECSYCCENLMEFSLNWAELSLNSMNSMNSGNSENLRNHWSMNWVQYKDLLCYLCLCGLVVSSLSLIQEILRCSPTLPFLYFISFFYHWIQRIQWKHLEKTPLDSIHTKRERCRLKKKGYGTNS